MGLHLMTIRPVRVCVRVLINQYVLHAQLHPIKAIVRLMLLNRTTAIIRLYMAVSYSIHWSKHSMPR